MNIINQFKIDNSKCLEFLVPNFQEKKNRYYKPMLELHSFDIITIVYKSPKLITKLEEDSLEELVLGFRNSLKRLLNNMQILPNDIQVGDLGYQYNIHANNDDDVINYGDYWLWSLRGMHTWLYEKDNKLFLEIAPSYPWHYVDPKKDENIVSFKDFMKNYAPIAVHELNVDTVNSWINQADLILNKIKKSSK